MTKRIYVPISILLLIIAIVGFWLTYFGHLVTETVVAIPLIHFHAVVYVTWLLIVIGQSVLASTGNLKLHKSLGSWLMLDGLLVIITGLAVTFVTFGEQIANGHLDVGQRKLFGPIRDIVFFIPFYWAAWHWRNKGEIHKRLIIVATNILLVAAVVRMTFLGKPVPEWKLLMIWTSPVYIGMIHDYVSTRKVHSVYIIGLIAMIMMRVILPFRTTALWLKFSGWIATFYG